jgi:hypothetical protein
MVGCCPAAAALPASVFAFAAFALASLPLSSSQMISTPSTTTCCADKATIQLSSSSSVRAEKHDLGVVPSEYTTSKRFGRLLAPRAALIIFALATGAEERTVAGESGLATQRTLGPPGFPGLHSFTIRSPHMADIFGCFMLIVPSIMTPPVSVSGAAESLAVSSCLVSASLAMPVTDLSASALLAACSVFCFAFAAALSLLCVPQPAISSWWNGETINCLKFCKRVMMYIRALTHWRGIARVHSRTTIAIHVRTLHSSHVSYNRNRKRSVLHLSSAFRFHCFAFSAVAGVLAALTPRRPPPFPWPFPPPPVSLLPTSKYR